jgi:hypothetical protein
MMRHSVRIVLAAVTAAFTACGGTPSEPGTGSSAYTLRLVSPAAIRVADALTPVPDTLLFELLDASGLRVRQVWRLSRSSATTGWLRTPEWERRAFSVAADTTTGLARVLWLPSDQPEQVLSLGTNWGDGGQEFTRRFTLARRGVPLVADTVVTSGPESVCIQQGGRVACVGPGQFQPALRWLRFSAPVRSLSASLVGVCALLTDGNTACWNGIGPDAFWTGFGPDSTVPNDITHPPFVEFRGSVGRTAGGALWKGVFGSETGGGYVFANRTWLPIPSDSTIARLLNDENGLVTCGLTASGVVMCSMGRRVTPVFPGVPFTVTPFQVLRNAADSSVLRAVGGYTSVAGVNASYSRDTNVVTLRAPDGTGTRVVITQVSNGSVYGAVTPDATLPGTTSETRARVPSLDGESGAGGAWRSVTSGGRLGRVHLDVIAVGHRVTCGVREFVVCARVIAGGDRQIADIISVDTVRLAP